MLNRYDKQTEEEMKKFYKSLNERQRRLYAAQEATKLGYGGNKYISELLSINPKTIYNGQKELKENIGDENIVTARRKGGGRKKK